MLLCTNDSTWATARRRPCPSPERRARRRRARTRWRTPPATGTAAARRPRAAGTTTRSSPGSCRGGPRPAPTDDAGARPGRRGRRRSPDAERRRRAAASSMASGSPSSRRHSSSTDAGGLAPRVGAGRRRPLAEQLDRVGAGSSGRTADARAPRRSQRLAARGHDRQLGTRCRQPVDRRGRVRRRARSCRAPAGVAVAGEAALIAAERVGDAVGADGEGDGVGHVVGVGDAGQRHEPHRRRLGSELGRGGDGEAGLADAADAGERHDPLVAHHPHALDVRSRPTSDDRGAGRLPTEARRCVRAGMRCRARDARPATAAPARSRSRSRWVPTSASSTASPPPSGPARRDVREQDLAAVPGGHDARRPVDGSAPEIVPDPLDLTGVDAHAHGQAPSPQRALGGDRGPSGALGGPERRRHAVAERGEDLAAGRRRPPCAGRRSGARPGRTSPATPPTAASTPRCP